MKFVFGIILSMVLIVEANVNAFAKTKVVPQASRQIQLSFAPLVKKTAPGVVNVYTSKIVRTRQMTPLFNDPFFQQFFGGRLQDQRLGAQKQVQNSLGSGVIIDGHGIIVTNNHVIEGAESIKVVLADRREFEARLVGTDKRTDIAVLKIEPHGEALPYLQFSDPDSLEIGDLVLAIGNPFGVGQTVTSGIVSAKARTNISSSDLNSFIQTDAAINPGNSGGALIDMNGRLVGVNTAIFTKSGGSNGIGFAIPVNMVSHVVKSLLNSGDVVRPWLGAIGQNVTANIAQALGLSRPIGVMVTSVYDLGPAHKAGVKTGDVLLSINGHELADLQDLRFRIATLNVGDTANVKVMRRDGQSVLKMTMESPPETPKMDERVLRGRHPFDGALVANLSPKLTDQIGLSHTLKGVIVLKLDPNKTAAQVGLNSGDIVLKINNQVITSTKQLSQLLKTPMNGWLIALQRGGRKIKLVVR